MTRPLSSDARVVFIQSGNFLIDDTRIREGKGEVYHAQKYSMDVVARLVDKVALAAVISIRSDPPYDTLLPSGVRAIGLRRIWDSPRPFDAVIAQLEALEATHVVLRMPSVEILNWARNKGVRVLSCLADSFAPGWTLKGLRSRWRLRQLARAMNHPSVDVIGNHNIGASQSLAAIGVAPEKIVPWDWPRTPTPDDFPAKKAPAPGSKRLIAVGKIKEEKGSGDILRALAADPALHVTLDMVGGGDIDEMQALAEALGVTDRVTFTGRVPYEEVGPRMHTADAVLVYTRKSYGEGLPGTLYQGLAARTPMVVSDHPMFASYLQDGRDVRMIPEQSPSALAEAIKALFEDTELYQRLSENSAAAFARLQHPVMWAEFVERWLANTPDDRAWITANALPHWQKDRVT